jgi:hypothetical protein
VTAKEKLLERAPHGSEKQADRALRAEDEPEVDEWRLSRTVIRLSVISPRRKLHEHQRDHWSVDLM